MKIKIRPMIFKLTLTTFLIANPILGSAQFEFPSPSPMGTMTQIVGNTKIMVEYERPSVRGRKIYGDLVPWNEVWRTGAGKCTRISFDKDVMVGNQPVAAGAYSLFTIPNKEEWLVIINSDTTLYGAGFYDMNNDIARFPVKSKKTARFYEAMTIDIDIVPNNAKIYISWADTQIGFDIHTSTDEITLKYIEETMLKGKVKDVGQYGIAAEYLNWKNMRYKDALDLAQKMIDKGGNEGWGRNIKWRIYEKMHLYEKALEEIAKGLKHDELRDYEKEEWRLESIRFWKGRAERIRAKQKGSSNQ